MLVQIWKESSLVKLMVLAFILGLGFIAYGQFSGLPSRANLQKIDGVVSEASKVTKKRRRSGTTTVTYELTVRPDKAGMADLKLTIPAVETSETDIRSIISRPIQAEYDSESDVYVLTSGGKQLLTYDATIERRKLGLRQYHVDGIAILTGSSVLLLVAAGWTFFKLRRRGADPAEPPVSAV
jgi:hypothetical protein